MTTVAMQTSLYGICRKLGYCVEDCGLCAFIDVKPTAPSYAATNKASSYKRKKAEGTLLPPSTPGFQVGYKEPLRKVEDGFGFFGTLTITQDKSYVQCHVCGFFFRQLGQHVREHELSGREYKHKFGLAVGTLLMTENASEEFKQQRPYNYSQKHRQQLHSIREKALLAQQGSTKLGRDGLALEYYNKFGICPDQLIEKYVQLKKDLKHAPSYREMCKAYNTGTPRLLMRVFGGRWSDVKQELSNI